MSQWLWPSVIFICVSGFSFVTLALLNLRRLRRDPRLPEDTGDEVDLGASPTADTSTGSRSDILSAKSSPTLVQDDVSPALARQMPSSEQEMARLQPELVAAGYYNPNALSQYLLIRFALIILPLLLACILAILLDKSRIIQVVAGGMAFAVLGYALPRIFVHYQARVRRYAIEGALPVAVDLLALGITSGQNVLTAFKRVARELKFSHPVLANELALVHRQANLTSLTHALEQLAARVQLPEVQNLVMILTQSERLGSDVAAALLEFASNFRTTLRQRAEARANRASFWMLFPTLFCLWLPAAIVLIGPIIFEAKEKNDERQRIMEAQKNSDMFKGLDATAAPVFNKDLRKNDKNKK